LVARWVIGAVAFLVAATAIGGCTSSAEDSQAGTTPQPSMLGTKRNDVIRGTSGADLIRGLAGNDQLFGLRGADRLEGGPGSDSLTGGPGDDMLTGGLGKDTLIGDQGTDTILGGDGDDEILAEDGTDEVVDCGSGFDSVRTADEGDEFRACELMHPNLVPNAGTVELVDQTWECSEPVNLDLVKVTMQVGQDDAINILPGCTGLIGRIEVDTWTNDGIKVQWSEPQPHDLVVLGGYVNCHSRALLAHQDGIQVMGGQRLIFRDLVVNCTSRPNAQLFISGVNGAVPTDVVCDRCFLGTGAASTLFVAESLRSGARNSTICAGVHFDVRVGNDARDVVNARNRVLPATHARCAS
jgi:hypothetical protein